MALYAHGERVPEAKLILQVQSMTTHPRTYVTKVIRSHRHYRWKLGDHATLVGYHARPIISQTVTHERSSPIQYITAT